MKSKCSVLALLAVGFIVPMAPAQSTLSLDTALTMASERNGTVRSAALNAKAAHERATQSFSAFLPKVTPEYTYVSNRQSVKVGGNKIFSQTEGGTTTATASWRILDFGQRQLSYQGARASQSAAEASAFQTLRQTLFNVFSEYVEALRAQETLKVNDAQVERANKILEQTQARVKAGDEAGKEILQAKADALNAVVSQLTQKQRTTTTLASLKGSIGWSATDESPTLETLGEPSQTKPDGLTSVIAYALENRPDLRASRLNLQNLRYSKLRIEKQAGPTFSLDASFTQTLTPSSLENRNVTFLLSTPLFDGGLTRSQLKEAKLSLEAGESTYLQDERTARAEIEAAYLEVLQNFDRLKAAQAALEAAQLNYKASSEAQRLGAATVIDVLTARVSLATAENNAIQAKYDALLAEKKLALVSGQPVFGGV